MSGRLAGISNVEAQRLFTQWKPLTEKMAFSAARRAHVIAPHLDVEDFRQIVRLALLKAHVAFNPEFGVKFITFLYRAVLNEINRAMLTSQRAAESGVFVNTASTTEEGEQPDLDNYCNDGENPESLVMLCDLERHLVRVLRSPELALVRAYFDPPPLIRAQLNQYFTVAESVTGTRVLTETTLPLLARLLGLPAHTATRVRRALNTWRLEA